MVDSSRPGEPKPGCRLDRYEMLAPIARGGMAEVWIARQRGVHGFQKLVAIKTIRPQFAADPIFRSMFLDEARLAARIAHPNVAQILDLGEQEGMLYLAMEWVDGESLQRLRKGLEERNEAFPVGIALRIAADVARGLHAAHELRDAGGVLLDVVHRDVSPHNILLSAGGVPKLIDFGVAKARDRNTGETTAGIIKGKIEFMAPEQAGGDPVDRRTDVWSLGAALYALLAGQAPFHTNRAVATLQMLSSRASPPALPARVPPAVAHVVARALAHDKGARYTTALDLADAIESTMRAIGEPASSQQIAAFASSRLGPQAAERKALIDRALRWADARSRDSHPRFVSIAPQAPSTSSLVPTVGAAPPPSGRGARAFAVTAGVVVFGATVAAVTLGGRHLLRVAHASAQAASLPSSSGASTSPPTSTSTSPSTSTCPQGMAEIPGGSFFMGSDDDLDLEKPAHKVKLTRYCMDIYEVTTADYKACSDRGDCRRASRANQWSGISDHERDVFDPVCNIRDPSSRATHPINCVDWTMADEYCRMRAARLPTEAEWEFAARGPDGRKYPWGDALPTADLLNACGSECVKWTGLHDVPQEGAMFEGDDRWPTTAPVGSFPRGASPFGLRDIVGNVWEWVADWYAPYTPDVRTDPAGPQHGEARVIRGGGWNGAHPAWARPTFRYRSDPATRSHGIGFRCARAASL
jgi:formylglycine-generating enzyme required for sulfatase activity/tRNA A-37 threonylcarbamoyl transferase component Bud32